MTVGTIDRSTTAVVVTNGAAGTPGYISRSTVSVVLVASGTPGYVGRSTVAVVLDAPEEAYSATITADCTASPSPGVEYEWEWRDDEAAEPAWEALGSTDDPSIEIPDAEDGHDYSVRVRAVFTSTGAFSDWVEGSLTTEAP